MRKQAEGAYCNNIKLGESPFAVVDHLYHAFVGNAKIGTVSGVAQAQINGDWCGVVYHARGGSGAYKSKRTGEKIEPKEKRRKLERDEKGQLSELDEGAQNSLMTMIFKKRKHFREQYAADEEKQVSGRAERRKRTGEKGRRKQEKAELERAQYLVMERVTTKEELALGLGLKAKGMRSAAAKTRLLQEQLNIRYRGFQSVPKQSWSCAKEGRKGTWEELKATLEAVLEGEKDKPLQGRLEVEASALQSAKLPVLGAESSKQAQQLDSELQERIGNNAATSAEAAFIPRAARPWDVVCLRTWPRALSEQERGLKRGLKFKDEGEEWVIEGIDYDEDKGWVVYYYSAEQEAPAKLSDCEFSSVSEVLEWALGVEWVDPAKAEGASAAAADATAQAAAGEGA